MVHALLHSTMVTAPKLSQILKSYYSYSYTTAEANAVAQLMKDVGYACNVHYGVNSTSAYTYNAVTALLRHLDYSPQSNYFPIIS